MEFKVGIDGNILTEWIFGFGLKVLLLRKFGTIVSNLRIAIGPVLPFLGECRTSV